MQIKFRCCLKVPIDIYFDALQYVQLLNIEVKRFVVFVKC